MEFHHNLSVWEIKNKFISKIINYNFSVSFKFFKIKFQKKNKECFSKNKRLWNNKGFLLKLTLISWVFFKPAATICYKTLLTDHFLTIFLNCKDNSLRGTLSLGFQRGTQPLGNSLSHIWETWLVKKTGCSSGHHAISVAREPSLYVSSTTEFARALSKLLSLSVTISSSAQWG